MPSRADLASTSPAAAAEAARHPGIHQVIDNNTLLLYDGQFITISATKWRPAADPPFDFFAPAGLGQHLRLATVNKKRTDSLMWTLRDGTAQQC